MLYRWCKTMWGCQLSIMSHKLKTQMWLIRMLYSPWKCFVLIQRIPQRCPLDSWHFPKDYLKLKMSGGKLVEELSKSCTIYQALSDRCWNTCIELYRSIYPNVSNSFEALNEKSRKLSMSSLSSIHDLIFNNMKTRDILVLVNCGQTNMAIL